MLNLNYINCRQPAKKGQVYFGRFYLGKRKRGHAEATAIGFGAYL